MKLTIITEDRAVGKDGMFYHDLDLTSCSVPTNVWALQWNNNSGHIEYKGDNIQNESITELPAWATAAQAVWQTAETARLAAEAAAAAAAAQAEE